MAICMTGAILAMLLALVMLRSFSLVNLTLPLLSDSVEACCKSHFLWDLNCGVPQLASILQYFPDHSASQCDSKPMTEFKEFENERFDTLDECCLAKFPNDLVNCCGADGLGGCIESGVVKYLPDWLGEKCVSKGANYVLPWEESWAQDSVTVCCDRCECDFANPFALRLHSAQSNRFFPQPSIVFKYGTNCVTSSTSTDLSALKFYPNHSTSECGQKALGEFETWESRFESLDDCCRNTFPNSLSECCDVAGLGGCVLSGDINYVPDWIEGKCAPRDANLLADWELDWTQETMAACCDRCESVLVLFVSLLCLILCFVI